MGVDSALRQLTFELEERLDVLLEKALEKIRAEVGEYDLDRYPDLEQPLRDGSRAGLRAALLSIRDASLGTDAIAHEMLAEARSAARSGMSLNAILRSYRVGHALVWDEFLGAVAAHELPERDRWTVLQIASKQMFAYFDQAVAAVGAEYARESDRWLGRDADRRGLLVRHVINGATIDDAELGYPISGRHVGVVASGPDAGVAIDDVAHRLGGPAIVVAAEGDELWGWVSAPAGDEPLALVAPARRAVVGVGDALEGADGFRESHRLAVTAHNVGRRSGAALTRYDDVVLESLALKEDSVARSVIARELGPLAGDDERAAMLRATLGAYLGASMNAASAGAVLKVTDRTVAYRLRLIEELIGRRVSTRYVELALALRLYRTLIQQTRPAGAAAAPDARVVAPGGGSA